MGGVENIVLVGYTGNGKSATGNSILGRRAFKSMSRFQGVTTACQLSSTVLQDGQTLNVIDTPGLFDSSMSTEYVENEIVRCIQLAKDGVHAILIVISLKVRFSKEQGAVVDTLKHLFGEKILDYMIVAFTGGDDLDEDETLDDRLASCPEALKELLEKCGNKRVVFDNKTKDEDKKAEQRGQLLTLIDEIIEKNGGKPYTRDLMVEFKNGDATTGKQAYNEQQMQQLIAETVHRKLKERNEEIISMLEKDFKNLQKKNDEMISKLMEELLRAQREEKDRQKAREKQRKLKQKMRELKEELDRVRREMEKPKICPLM